MINFETERTVIPVPANRGGGTHGAIWLSRSSNNKGPLPNRINFTRTICNAAGISPGDRVELQHSNDAIFLSKHKVGLLTVRHANSFTATDYSALIVANTFALASIEAWCRRRYGKSINDITDFEYETRDGVIGFAPLFDSKKMSA